jgi:hypothetical protein
MTLLEAYLAGLFMGVGAMYLLYKSNEKDINKK